MCEASSMSSKPPNLNRESRSANRANLGHKSCGIPLGLTKCPKKGSLTQTAGILIYLITSKDYSEIRYPSLVEAGQRPEIFVTKQRTGNGTNLEVLKQCNAN